MCEAVSSQFSDVNTMFESLILDIEEGLQEVEENPEFTKGVTRLKSVKVTLAFFKNQQITFVSKTLSQHEWSWKTFALTFLVPIIGPTLYIVNHKHSTIYSRENTHALVKQALNELIISETRINTDLISCSVRVNSANHSLFSTGGYWLHYKNSSKEISHVFTDTTPAGSNL